MSNYTKETLIASEFIPPNIKENTKIFFSHFSRYWYAAKVLNINNSSLVLDASCGTGYGTYSLATKARYTVGLDINKDYIKMAQEVYDNENIAFLTYEDYFNSPHSNKSQINKIVCIETYEHIPKEDSNQFIENLLNYLCKGGDFFLTVPLGNNQPSTYNKFHLNEPSLQSVFDLFSPYFEKIEIEIDSFVNSFNQECQYCFLICRNKKELIN